ncbi:MAG: aminomethyl-transferring glycine dehydrogenase subunit GcvPA [Thermoanaerobaculia bacterium]
MAPPHRYLPTGDADRREMLETIGVADVDQLFASLPEAVRLERPPAVPGPLSDQELRRYFRRLEGQNRVGGRDVAGFLGAGSYRHEIPAAVDHLLQRSEFFTVYTPYQPEVSQGTLQTIFEFQTFMSLLTGLPVANASLYDGASAFAEAILMADRLQPRRRKVVISRTVHPQYRATLAGYVQNLDLDVVEVGWDERGATDLASLAAAVDEETVCVAVQSPNYFGVVEGWRDAAAVARSAGALTVGVVAEALSMALLESPGDGGCCDIACGEAQSFGLPAAYGGPYLGFLASRDDAKRAMPGRLAGKTVDADGRPAYVLTLSTREQHIRREKATSNICTNQNLCALAATIYLALHGKVGLRRLAELNLQRAAALRRRLDEATGLAPRFASPHFNELTLRCDRPVEEALGGWRQDGVLGGVPLGPDYPELEDCLLVAVTECNPPEELDRFVEIAARRAQPMEVAAGA